MKIALILLAAGFSRRFGENKLCYPVDGVPMGERALRLHASLPYARRVLITQSDYEAFQATARGLGYEIRINPEPERGIGSSVACGVDDLLSDGERMDAALFAVADQPYLRKETVIRFLQAFTERPDRIAALASNGRRGNPVVFPHAYFDELRGLTGDRGGSQVLRAHPDQVVLYDFAAEEELSDVDQK